MKHTINRIAAYKKNTERLPLLVPLPPSCRVSSRRHRAHRGPAILIARRERGVSLSPQSSGTWEKVYIQRWCPVAQRSSITAPASSISSGGSSEIYVYARRRREGACVHAHMAALACVRATERERENERRRVVAHTRGVKERRRRRGEMRAEECGGSSGRAREKRRERSRRCCCCCCCRCWTRIFPVS